MWVGCRHFVQDSKPHGPVCVWASSHKLCTRLCLSNVQDSQTCCLRVYTRLWNSTLDKCVMQRDLQMGACACSCQALPTFCFPFFVFSYNMLQHAHPDQWAMKNIYIYNFVMANSITFRIDCCHPSRNKKACSFLASCMWCALMLQEVIPLIYHKIFWSKYHDITKCYHHV
jgi:hypothetical protein